MQCCLFKPLTFCGPFVFIVLAGGAHGQTTLAEIKAVLEKRQERLESCTFKWVEVQVYEPASLIDPGAGVLFRLNANAARTGVPAATTTFAAVKEFAIKGSMARYTAPQISIDASGEIHLVDYVSSYDGKQSRYLSSPSDGPAHGAITVDTRNRDTPSRDLSPLLLALRPLDARLCGVNLDYSKIVRQSVMIDGADCVELQYRQMHLWLDRARGFAVRRMSSGNRTFSIACTKHSPDVWLPRSWQIVENNRAGRAQSITAKVKACLLDTNLEEKDFRLDFPVGASIRHEQDGKTEIIRSKPGT